MEPTFLKHKRTEGIIRTLLALFAAHFIVVNGTSYSIFELLVDKSYYVEIAFSFIVALIIVNWISRISNRFDKKYGWGNHWIERLSLQIALGILVPVLIEFFFVGAYFKILLGQNIVHTSFFYNEFRVVILMICTFNLYCVARYFFFRVQATEQELQRIKMQSKQEESINIVSKIPTDQDTKPLPIAENKGREIFILHTPVRSIPIKMEDIAYFYRKNKCNFLRTFEHVMPDAQGIDEKLKHIEVIAGATMFFRINRQMIVNFHACKSFKPGTGKKLEINLDPPFTDREENFPYAVVSEDRVKDFKIWMDR